MSRLNEKIAPFAENFAEATTACLVTMVQGNVLALSLSHWLIASETGIIAATVTSAAILVAGVDKRWLVSVVLGVATAVVDYFVHPGMFGPVFLEAIVTGAGASVLSFGVGTLIRFLRHKRTATGN